MEDPLESYRRKAEKEREKLRARQKKELKTLVKSKKPVNKKGTQPKD